MTWDLQLLLDRNRIREKFPIFRAADRNLTYQNLFIARSSLSIETIADSSRRLTTAKFEC